MAGAALRLLFHGHGVRRITVVVPPVFGGTTARLVEVLVRRFKCCGCGAVVTIYPPGVIPRYLYSLVAIVTAWWHSLRPPMGPGLSEAAVYARQGVDRFPVGLEKGRTGARRWRSLARWAAQLDRWWPARPATGSTWRTRITSLLLGFLAEGGGEEGLLARAVRAFASSEAAM